jgi:hypothetical protein
MRRIFATRAQGESRPRRGSCLDVKLWRHRATS